MNTENISDSQRKDNEGDNSHSPSPTTENIKNEKEMIFQNFDKDKQLITSLIEANDNTDLAKIINSYFKQKYSSEKPNETISKLLTEDGMLFLSNFVKNDAYEKMSPIKKLSIQTLLDAEFDNYEYNPPLNENEKNELKNIFKRSSKLNLDSNLDLSKLKIIFNIIYNESLTSHLEHNLLQKINLFVEKQAEIALELNSEFLAKPTTSLQPLVLMSHYEDVPSTDAQPFKIFASLTNPQDRIAFLNELMEKDPKSLGFTLIWSVVTGNIPIEVFSKTITQ